MNVFILNTGRCGSTTFIMACKHMTNFTAGHETRASLVGDDRLAFPANHIEADNRLSWILGRLDRTYGDNAMYVHLQRNHEATAKSFVHRYGTGIIRAYQKGILMRGEQKPTPMQVSLDYCDTVDSNIECFLKDKTHKMSFHLESAAADFEKFWHWVGAEGDMQAALAEFESKHNPSRNWLARMLYKLRSR